MDDATLLEVLHATATAIADALGDLDDWGLAGTEVDQYRHDLAADAAALAVLDEAGRGRAVRGVGRPATRTGTLVVVIDPVDGSTNASQGIPWYATSLCAVDADGPRAAVVVNQASGVRFEAVRGGGARKDGVADPAVGLRAAGRGHRRRSAATRRGTSAGSSTGAWVRPPSTSARWPKACSTGTRWSAVRSSAVGTTWGGCWSAPRPAPSLGEAQGTGPRHPVPRRTPGTVRRGDTRRCWRSSWSAAAQ